METAASVTDNFYTNYSVMTRPPAEDRQEAVTIKASDDLKRQRPCLM